MAAKWAAYYRAPEPPPWHSGGPCSSLVRLIDSGKCSSGRSSFRVLEAGCGSGQSLIWLAGLPQRYPSWAETEVTTLGVDIVPEAIRGCIAAREAARDIDALRTSFACADLFELPRPCFRPADGADAVSPSDSAFFDLVLDVQCFQIFGHELREAYVHIVASNLVAGGHALVLCGAPPAEAATAPIAAEEPPWVPGPSVLTRSELTSYWSSPAFDIVSLVATRFDPTPYYCTRPQPPPAWELLVRKR